MPDPLPPAARALLDALWKLPAPHWRAFLAEAHQAPLPAPDRLTPGQRAAAAAELRAITDGLRYLARYNPGLTLAEVDALEGLAAERLGDPLAEAGL